jgi:hypothetical protein
MPRILRSPGSKSFRLENVSVPNEDGARCERRQHPRRPKAKFALGQNRKYRCFHVESALPPRTDIRQLDPATPSPKTCTWPRPFIVLMTRLSNGYSGVSVVYVAIPVPTHAGTASR